MGVAGARRYAVAVHVEVGREYVEIRLARWQKVLGLMRDISVPRAHVHDVEVIEDPLPVVMGAGFKAGLRLPWFYYVARTIKLDEAFVVRKGVPALSFTVEGAEPLRRVLVSTVHARELAEQLGGAGARA